jgi:DNA-binding CsgD family transcriptional regulator
MSYRTDLEIFLGQQIDLLRIEKAILEHGKDWKDFLNDIPGFIHMNLKKDISVAFMNKTGTNETGFTNIELNELGYSYQEQHLDPYSLHITPKKLVPFIKRDDENKIFSFAQSFRRREGKKYNLIYTVTKPLRGGNSLLTYSLSMKEMGIMSKKVSRLLRENEFLHNNFLCYQSLTPKEIEVLILLSSGNTNKEISEQLFISIDTVKQHRKIIKRKTECRNIVELVRFAQAFDLI